MHYQLFIPHASNAQQGLAEVGLRGLAENVSFMPLQAGPGGLSGVLCSWVTNKGVAKSGYDPGQQQWEPSAADGEDCPAGRYWVGYWNKQPPKPEELQRPYPYVGTMVRLGDGKDWMFPRAEAVPRDMLLKDDGSTAFVPQRKLHEFVTAAELMRPALQGLVPGAQVRWTQLRDLIQVALCVNYRVTPEVCSRLKLWSHTEAGTVWRAVSAVLNVQEVPING